MMNTADTRQIQLRCDDEQKDRILLLLREKGFRITKQRRLILDIIFSHECCCCKEIYYEALAADSEIGISTVYRMINTLSDLGVFQSDVPLKNLCQAKENEKHVFLFDGGCSLVLEDRKNIVFSETEWKKVIDRALAEKGYSGKKAVGIVINSDVTD